MSPRAGFIVNPLSHTVQRKGSVLERAARDLTDVALIRISTFSSLPDQVRRLTEAGVSTLFIEGGDGTLQAVMSALVGAGDSAAPLPDIAILAGGSTNLAYKIAGLRCSAPDQVAAYVTAYRAGAEVSRTALPALQMSHSGLASPLAGMLLSTGSLARAMLYTQTQLHGDGQRGSMAVADAALRFVLAPGAYKDADGAPLLRPSELSAESATFHHHGPHALSLMTTLPSLSLGLKPFWGHEEAGPIAYTHAAWPIAGFRRAFLKILAGATGPGMARHGLQSHRAGEITLTCEDPIVLDGEVLQMPPDGRITVRPTRPFRFLR